MSNVMLPLGLSGLGVLFMWFAVWQARMEVVDMASLYKPSIHGDQYKAKCLNLYRRYKKHFFFTGATTVVYLCLVWHVWGNLLS